MKRNMGKQLEILKLNSQIVALLGVQSVIGKMIRELTIKVEGLEKEEVGGGEN